MAGSSTKKKTAPTRGGNVSSARKKSTAASRTPASRNTKKTSGKNSKKNNVKREIWVLFGLALAALLFLSLLDLVGVVGKSLAAVQFGLFGSLAYLFPFLLLLLIAFAVSNMKSFPVNTWLRIFLALLTFSFLCGLAELAGSGGDLLEKLGDYYARGRGSRFHGGFFGGFWCLLFLRAFGTIGSYLILTVLFLAGMVLTLGRALLIPLGIKGKEMAHAIKDETQRHRAASEERRRIAELRAEERLQRRAEERQARALKEEEERRAFRQQLDERMAKRDNKPSGGEKAESKLEFKQVKKRTEDPQQMRFDLDQTSLSSAPLPSQTLLDELLEEIESHKVGVAPEKRTLAELGELEKEKPAPRVGGLVEKGPSKKTEPRISISAQPEKSPFETEIDGGRPERPETDLSDPARMTGPELGWTDPREQMAKQPEKKSQSGELPETVLTRKEYKLPPTNLLTKGRGSASMQESDLKHTALLLEETLRNFGVEVSVTDISCGPSVIRYELRPEQGVKVARISALADDIKLALAATEIRIEAPIPGKSAVGIEVPNRENQTVYLRSLIESEEFQHMNSKLGFAVGQDIGGKMVVADLAKMPHMLIAGATGSGKSVCINSLILSILYRAKPDEVQLIMIDPKVVELGDYNGIPHLRIPVVTDPRQAAEALNGAVKEMTGRYKKFADLNVRDIKSYNAKIRENPEEYPDQEVLPQIVIIVDEFADLMMTAKGDVEQAVCRLAQLARAAGIHLVIATQRPSVNVITGLIKANIQSRIALTVSSGVDSRTIIDQVGAEKLLGRGDMLFYPTGYPKPVRVQGCWVSDEEIEAVTNFWKKQGSVSEEEMAKKNYDWMNDPAAREHPEAEERDELFLEAAAYIIKSEKASIGNLQRVFRIGFNRAARIMDQLADAGIVGAEEGTKARQILMDQAQLEDWKRENGC